MAATNYKVGLSDVSKIEMPKMPLMPTPDTAQYGTKALRMKEMLITFFPGDEPIITPQTLDEMKTNLTKSGTKQANR